MAWHSCPQRTRRLSIALPEPGDRSYSELIRRPPGDPPESYRLTSAQREDAPGETEEVRRLGVAMSGQLLGDGAPRPTPALRIRPTF